MCSGRINLNNVSLRCVALRFTLQVSLLPLLCVWLSQLFQLTALSSIAQCGNLGLLTGLEAGSQMTLPWKSPKVCDVKLTGWDRMGCVRLWHQDTLYRFVRL
jgi:hypothetical protein